uniref:Unspecific monooxygenase n=1 Tax=Steinernema glaseri TaxID=37863 RepID=A0A1I7YMM6_9BILA
MAANLLDLYFGGTETSISSLLWAFLFMMKKPKIQKKLRAEVLKTTGGNRHVEITDKANMPYANAVVTEILRRSSIVMFNILHETTAESIVGDYKLPKGTVISPQVSVVLRDQTLFKNPLEFNPDRYLDNKNGKLLEKKVIPFGLGKRACLGESLARAEIFLVLTNFVQRYKFSPLPGQSIDLTPVSIVTNLNRTRPYRMIVEKV